MIEKLSIKNFRNFSESEFSFSPSKNIIIGNNGQGKTNILEALALPVSPLVESLPEYLIARGSDHLYLKYQLTSGEYSYSYERESRKKRYLAGKNICSKTKIHEVYPHVVAFHPLLMNMMYLGPSERRDYIDTCLCAAIVGYKKYLSEYKKILISRNRVLKNIFEQKSELSELEFWNIKFVEVASQIYTARQNFLAFIHDNIHELEKYFFGKVHKIQFSYISKTNIASSKESLENFISTHQEQELLTRRTLIGPHLDDFDILLDDTPIIHYASRGEVKSCILALKFLETHFIEKYSQKKEILFLIDDLLSELDSEHREKLWQHIGERQCVMSSIEDSGLEGNKIFI